MSAKRTPQVVILGGGYVAIYAVKALRGAIKRGEIKVTVIDKNNYHCFHGLVPEMLVGKIQAGQIISPARRIFHPARFVVADIQRVDVDNKTVVVRRKHDDQSVDLTYDHLIVGLGSVDNLTRYRGIGEHTLRLKSYWDIIGCGTGSSSCWRWRNWKRIQTSADASFTLSSPAETTLESKWRRS